MYWLPYLHDLELTPSQCDKAEPSCSQCLAAGLLCEGYGRDLVWVNATAEEEPAGRMRRPQANQLEPWQVRHAGQPGINIDVILRESLAKTAREQKYLGLFWSAYLPNGRAFTSRACRLSTGGWTAHMGKLYDAEPTLRLASLAMSASVIGNQNNDRQLIIKGLKAYSEAIQEMAKAVASDSRRLGDGLLAAARLMEFYEVCEKIPRHAAFSDRRYRFFSEMIRATIQMLRCTWTGGADTTMARCH